jgi:hypothetical protein
MLRIIDTKKVKKIEKIKEYYYNDESYEIRFKFTYFKEIINDNFTPHPDPDSVPF